MSFLPDVFIEAVKEAIVIPFGSEATIHAMKSFGGHDMVPAVATAIVAALIGHSLNWGIGKALMKLPSSPKSHTKYLKLQTLFNKYGFFLLFFAFAPLMNIVVVASGMFGTPLKKALPLILLGLAYHYGMLLA